MCLAWQSWRVDRCEAGRDAHNVDTSSSPLSYCWRQATASRGPTTPTGPTAGDRMRCDGDCHMLLPRSRGPVAGGTLAVVLSAREHSERPAKATVRVPVQTLAGFTHGHAVRLVPVVVPDAPADFPIPGCRGPCHAVPLCQLDALCLGLALVGLARCCVCLDRPDQQQCCDQESPGGD